MFRIDIEKYPKIKQKLQSLLGSKADLSTLAVFEARANDTLPISGAGGFLKDARMSRSYLQTMADLVAGGQYVPIIELHNQQGSLPQGRIFDAAVFDHDEKEGEADLHILFYLEAEHTYTGKIDKGIISELSTGTTMSELKCSSCGYDFLASSDNRRNLYKGKGWTPLCPEGHQWGMGGNHLKLTALGKWKETSVVTRGAVERAKILGENQWKLALSEKQINLAASDNDDTLLIVTLADAAPEALKPNSESATFNENNSMSDVTLPKDEYKALLLADAKAEEFEGKLQAAITAKDDAEAKLQAAEQAKEAAESAKSELETKLQAAEDKATELQTKLDVALSGAGNKGKGVGEEGEQGEGVDLSATLPNDYFKAN